MSLSHPRRIGVFGGAFDPPHRAHLALAHAALAQFGLDELRVLPTGQAWHKARPLSAAAHRVAMARLTFEHMPQVVVDDRETRREGATYTVDTLQALQHEQPHSSWWLFIGQDQATRFTTWHRWQDILAQVQLVVAHRPHGDAPNLNHDGLAEGQWHNALPAAVKAKLQVLDWSPQAISATAIRQAVAQNQDTQAWLLPQVQTYIQHHHLYSDNHE